MKLLLLKYLKILLISFYEGQSLTREIILDAVGNTMSKFRSKYWSVEYNPNETTLPLGSGTEKLKQKAETGLFEELLHVYRHYTGKSPVKASTALDPELFGEAKSLEELMAGGIKRIDVLGNEVVDYMVTEPLNVNMYRLQTNQCYRPYY